MHHAYRWRAARLVAVNSTRMSVDYKRASRDAMVTSRVDGLTRLEAKYPGSAASSGEPVIIWELSSGAVGASATELDGPFGSVLRKTLRELMSQAHTSSLLSSPQEPNGQIFQRESGTD